MKADWDRSSVRKPWGVKETTHLHSMCGAFIHFRSMFEAKVSSEEYAKHSQSLHSNFLQGFLDADLEHGLLTTVPPGDVTNIGFLRSFYDCSRCLEQLNHLICKSIFLSLAYGRVPCVNG